MRHLIDRTLRRAAATREVQNQAIGVVIAYEVVGSSTRPVGQAALRISQTVEVIREYA